MREKQLQGPGEQESNSGEMRINSCWQFMGSDRAREWTGSCWGGVGVRGSKKFS